MNETEVRSIIVATLKSGNKNPGLFDIPKLFGVKSKLESCNSISEVVEILEDSRSLISKSFGLSDSAFEESVGKIKVLEATA